MYTRLLIMLQLYRKPYKKLRCHEEHSASVVLSWCTLYISLEKICWWLINHFYVIGPKTTEFGEITQTTRPLRRSRSFKVTFWYQSKAHIRLPISENNETSILFSANFKEGKDLAKRTHSNDQQQNKTTYSRTAYELIRQLDNSAPLKRSRMTLKITISD